MRRLTSRLGALSGQWIGRLELILVLVVIVFLSAAAPAQAQQIKLYLKDGSYELVKTYQIQGDNIRFYNLDTSEWEEMPVALVDFEMTKRAQQDEAKAHQKDLEQAKVIDKERFDTPPAQTGFAVAPGRYLPVTEGVYAYDGLRVIPLVQSQGDVVSDKERAVLTMALPAPVLKKRALVTLPGPEAAVRIANPQPVFYIQANESWGANAELIPVKASRNSRLVEKVQPGSNSPGETRQPVPLERVTVAKGIVKLQPSKPLEPGEYALAELVDGKVNLDVWDFGIDRPGKKPSNVQDSADQQAAMGEQKPGESTRKVSPVDMIPGIPHPHQASPNGPSGPPLPGPGSDTPPPSPPSGQQNGPPN
ncbi:MAG TPA: hypothetical protein VI455_11535 [Terriglobia bacterium]